MFRGHAFEAFQYVVGRGFDDHQVFLDGGSLLVRIFQGSEEYLYLLQYETSGVRVSVTRVPEDAWKVL